MVRENLKALHELQAVDSKVLEVERMASVLPDKIRELESEVEKLRTEVGALNAELEGKRAAQRDIEGHVKEESEKHKKWKRRLNEIKTPREYQALSREVELGERQVREFEESILTIMGEVEQKQKVVSEKQGELKTREIEVAGKVRELRIRQAELAKEAARIATGRVEIVKTLPESLLKKYDQIRERRNGTAVVLVVDGTCMGCNVQLRPQMVVELLRYTSVTSCSGCYRILVPAELVRAPAPTEEG